MPQVGMSYGIVGNTLVQMPQTQYIAVDSTTGVVLGQQGGGTQYAVPAGGEEGRYVAMGGTTGYIAIGGGGQVIANPEGGSQVAVVQDANGQQRIVSLPASQLQGTRAEEEIKQPSPEVPMAIEEPSGSSLRPDVVRVKDQVTVKEETKDDMSSHLPESDVRVENGVELRGEGVQTARGKELAPSEDKSSTAEQVSVHIIIVCL